jgi:hypothetical protein
MGNLKRKMADGESVWTEAYLVVHFSTARFPRACSVFADKLLRSTVAARNPLTRIA